MTTEELLIKKIEDNTRAIRLGNKKPVDVAQETASAFTRLKPLNEGMHDELMKKYKAVVEDSKNRK